MKPRRVRFSHHCLLPTISELQEFESEPCPSPSLDDYLDSIRELSQPTYPLSGPLQGSRLPAPRMARFPNMVSTSPKAAPCKPWAPISPDHVFLTLVLRSDIRAGSTGSSQDPLDWLFTRSQTTGASASEEGTEEVDLL